MKEKRQMILFCQAQLRTYCVFVSKINAGGLKLTEVLPLSFWIGKVGPIVVFPPQLRSGLLNS